MTAREPDPIGPKPCPKCQQEGRTADPRTEYVAGKPYTCDTCDLWFAGTEAEFRRYRHAAIARDAVASTTRPRTDGETR